MMLATGCWLGSILLEITYLRGSSFLSRAYNNLIMAIMKAAITINQQMITIVLLGPEVFVCLVFNKGVKSV